MITIQASLGKKRDHISKFTRAKSVGGMAQPLHIALQAQSPGFKTQYYQKKTNQTKTSLPPSSVVG
jgi:hypothetical protein